jgi:hypothetical protein
LCRFLICLHTFAMKSNSIRSTIWSFGIQSSPYIFVFLSLHKIIAINTGWVKSFYNYNNLKDCVLSKTQLTSLIDTHLQAEHDTIPIIVERPSNHEIQFVRLVVYSQRQINSKNLVLNFLLLCCFMSLNLPIVAPELTSIC